MSENVSDNRNFESRQVPNDLEAERFLLGGILRDPEVMGTVIMVVTEEDFFYYERHKLIWRGLSGLYRKGTPIDLLTLSTELESYGKLAEAGGREYLFDLMESVASSANVEWNLEHLKNKSTLRKMIKAASETIKKAMDPSFNPDDVIQDAERDMLRATGGVNTHRGALFALGLMAVAAGKELKEEGVLLPERLSQQIGSLADDLSAQEGVVDRETHGTAAVKRYAVKGAMDMARGGYRELFEDWLPFWQSVKTEEYGLQKTLLRIIMTLDDTCVIHRAGFHRAQELKAEAAALLADFSLEKLKEMNDRMVSERVSPGGSADMLALTVYADLLINT